MDRNRYTTVIPAARALAARLGLDCAWVAYIAMLWLQSTLLFAQVGAGYRLSAKAVVLHLALIGLIAVLQATFWNTLPGKGVLHRWGRPIVAGTIQLVLLLLLTQIHKLHLNLTQYMKHSLQLEIVLNAAQNSHNHKSRPAVKNAYFLEQYEIPPQNHPTNDHF